MSDLVTLRPIRETEVAELLRFYSDPAMPGEFEWFGFRVSKARELERRWAEEDTKLRTYVSELEALVQEAEQRRAALSRRLENASHSPGLPRK